jgi:hypothetical protein
MPLQKRVVDLPAATGVTGSDQLILSSNLATKRVSLATLSGYFGTGFLGSGNGGSAPEAYQSPTAPATAAAGATWLDTSSGQYFVRYDGVWVEVGGQYIP